MEMGGLERSGASLLTCDPVQALQKGSRVEVFSQEDWWEAEVRSRTTTNTHAQSIEHLPDCFPSHSIQSIALTLDVRRF